MTEVVKCRMSKSVKFSAKHIHGAFIGWFQRDYSVEDESTIRYVLRDVADLTRRISGRMLD
jgi:hypothetical protein